MRRRDFIKVIGSTAVAWPLAARAQRSEEVRRIGVLMNIAADTREGQANVAAFHQGLLQLGWRDGDNVRSHTRWRENDIELDRKYATELVGLAPDVIVAAGTLSAMPREQRTRAFVWDRSADHIRARSQSGCIQRPNTWLHPNASRKRPIFLLHRGRRPYMALLGSGDRCRESPLLNVQRKSPA